MFLSNSSPTCARFHQFQVDLSSGVLQRAGVRVPVQAQPLQVLRLLLQADGKVVTREEIRKLLWPEDTFVDFELGVNTAVKKLRQALADPTDCPKFIETLPKIGYRFLVPVEWVTENGHSTISSGIGVTSAPESQGQAVSSSTNGNNRGAISADTTPEIVRIVPPLADASDASADLHGRNADKPRSTARAA